MLVNNRDEEQEAGESEEAQPYCWYSALGCWTLPLTAAQLIFTAPLKGGHGQALSTNGTNRLFKAKLRLRPQRRWMSTAQEQRITWPQIGCSVVVIVWWILYRHRTKKVINQGTLKNTLVETSGRQIAAKQEDPAMGLGSYLMTFSAVWSVEAGYLMSY